MIILVCLDDRDGMMFNHRRQSQDRLLREELLRITDGSRLWMNGYSAKQFSGEDAGQIMIAEDFLQKVGEGEYCFVEDQQLLPIQDRIEKLIIFKWNRHYPGNLFIDLPYRNWKLITTEEFVGSSHDKITKEVYIP